MKIDGRRVWQVAAGEPGRNYSDLFLDYDVMFIGPSHPGDPFGFGRYREAVERGEISKTKYNMIQRFNDAYAHDIILLRFEKKLIAIGSIASPMTTFDERFSEVYGWNLKHTKRVFWQNHLENDIKLKQPKEGIFHPRGRAFNEVHLERVINFIKPLIRNFKKRIIKKLPDYETNSLSFEEISELLFNEGLPYSSVEGVISAIKKSRWLTNWYRTYGKIAGRPKEHEVVAYLILPLMLALGWSEQLLAVEWKKIDLSGFYATPTTSDNCTFICEAKGLEQKLMHCIEQADRYIKNNQLQYCKKIILSDGALYFIYQKDSSENWKDKPIGYVNLNDIRTEYLLPKGANGIKTLMALTPVNIEHEVILTDD